MAVGLCGGGDGDVVLHTRSRRRRGRRASVGQTPPPFN